jgi:aminopeptidase YwaD
MEGRGDDTKGIYRAASMLEKRYKSLGLKPAGTHAFRQPFTVITGARLKGDTKLVVLDNNVRHEIALNRDFVPFSFSASGKADGPIVFVGYGATAPEFGYDDYASVDVKDKIVLVLRYEPSFFAERGGHQGLTQHSQVITKAINARDHGAKAMILVNGKLGDGEEDLLTRFGSVSGPENAGIMILQVKNAVADDWLRSVNTSVASVQAGIEHGGKTASAALPENLRVAAQVDIETTRATVNNVLAYLPGAKLTNMSSSELTMTIWVTATTIRSRRRRLARFIRERTTTHRARLDF